MRYSEFREAVQRTLHTHPQGMTWSELRDHCELPYDRPCPKWTRQLEVEIGLRRVRASGRELAWRLA